MFKCACGTVSDITDANSNITQKTIQNEQHGFNFYQMWHQFRLFKITVCYSKNFAESAQNKDKLPFKRKPFTDI